MGEFETLRPVIKARWAALLRAEMGSEPRVATALVNPAMLVFLLDDTLARLSMKVSSPFSGVVSRPGGITFTVSMVSVR